MHVCAEKPTGYFRGLFLCCQLVWQRDLNLRVVDEHGLQMTFGQIVVRNLMRGVDCLPMFYLVGGAACVLSRRSQRLGDVAAGTVVVRSVDVALPDLAGVSSDKDKYNSFTKYPHIEARLRQRIAPDEARIALQALLRRNSPDPDRRIELVDAYMPQSDVVAQILDDSLAPCPKRDSLIVCLTTLSGARITCRAAMIRTHRKGLLMVHPVWSLNAISLPLVEVCALGIRRSDEVPLSLLRGETIAEKAFTGFVWKWRRD